MFKIESYITPIILSHVDKYVKNIRPQDSQVSLWGGDVSFQNLDLRLDVLEEELNLPFCFLSGHIHELSIHVPWTKIASEPITITINTIEFVLKLKGPNDVNVRKKKISRSEEMQQAPPGYMASLVNKIANNISLKCHNVILKYVEEDIVVSMNIQLLSIDSADSEWNPAFVDISPINVLMRKVINITDLTICLDKRNAAGKIEVCQEPILYRCTLQLRMLRRYNISTAHTISVTRIDLHTKSMDLNISSQQFPMVMRLLFLGWMLKQGKIKSNPDLSINSESNQDSDQNVENQQSYFAWAWDLLPSIFPDENTEESDNENKGHLLQTGIYIDHIKFLFKSQEVFKDPIVYSTKKIKYIPFLKIEMNGIYCDSVQLGTKWFNMNGGISSIGIYPMGDCSCGHKQSTEPIFLTTNQPKDELNHFSNSLMDPECFENQGVSQKYNLSWESHLWRVSEEFLFKKTPAMCFDMVHHVEVPDDAARSVELGSDLEFSNLSEKILYRAFIGPFNLKYGSTMIHLSDLLRDYLKTYDYPVYVEEKIPLTISQLTPPSTDDYDALMTEIPIHNYQIVFVKPVFEIKIWDHNKTVRKKRITSEQFITVEFDRLDGRMSIPLYPNRLVHTTCQLPEPPKILLDSCYNKIEIFIKNTTVNLQKSTLIKIPKININSRVLLLQNLWTKNEELQRAECNLLLESLNFKFNRPQQMLFQLILESFLKSKLELNNLQESNLINDINDSELIFVEINLTKINLKFQKNLNSYACCCDVKSVLGFCYNPGSDVKSIIISGPVTNFVQGLQESLLQVLCQMPLDLENVLQAPLINLKLNEIQICLDPIFCEFFKYQMYFAGKNSNFEIPIASNKSESLPDYETPKKSNIERFPSGRFSQPMETVHSSSERNEPSISPRIDSEPSDKKNGFNLISIYNICRSHILNLEIRQCTIYIPNKSLKTNSLNLTLNQIISNNSNVNLTIFKLPFVKINSSISFPTSTKLTNQPQFPILVPKTLWSREKDGFPWTINLWGLSCVTIQNNIEYVFLSPVKTNVTVALTYKQEDLIEGQEKECPLAVCIHMDTAPIILNLYEEQVNFLYSSIMTLLLISTINSSAAEIDDKKKLILEIAQRPVSPGSNVDLKEFLGMTTQNSNSTKESFIEEISLSKDEIKNQFSIWLQWTFTKLTIQLFGKMEMDERKLIIEIEDIISSVDKQDVYIKIKNKIGSINGQHYRKTDLDVWTKNDSLGFNMRSDQILIAETNDTFFDLTITKAQTRNVHSKWGTFKRDRSMNETITEIMINMQSLDFRLDFELITPFIQIFKIFTKIDENQKKQKKTNTNSAVSSVADLPLIYFESKGVRLFIPFLTKNRDSDCDVFIINVNSVTINPSVENPLTRISVRPDIYTKAAQLRIITVPGSKIEDRQYEFLLKGISVATGNWKQMVNFMESYNSTGLQHVNPAFEWNNKQTTKNLTNAIVLSTILKEFNLSIIYAPCIIFKNVLVCGVGLELNCLTDLQIELLSNQILLIKSILDKINSLKELINSNNQEISIELTKSSSNLNGTHQTNNSPTLSNSNSSFFKDSKRIQSTTTYEKMILYNEYSRRLKSDVQSTDNFDSGVESLGQFSFLKNSKNRMNAKRLSKISIISKSSEEQQKIPYEIWFIGGVFSVKIFHHGNNEKTNEQTSLPLLAISISQPNMMISNTVFEKNIQMSIYDLNICLGTDYETSKENKNNFADVLFQTKRGDVNDMGISPSFFKAKFNQTSFKNNGLDVEFKKPMKFSLSHKTIEKMFALETIFESLFKQEIVTVPEEILRPVGNRFSMKLIKGYFRGVDHLNLFIAQTTLECSLGNEYDVKVSFSKIKSSIEIFDRPEKIIFDLVIKAFMMNTGTFIILHPVSPQIKGTLIQENWQKNPLLSFTLSLNCLVIDIGPENINNFLKIQKAFVKCLKVYERKEKVSIDLIKKPFENFENITLIPTPKYQRKSSTLTEEHYQDDLRAGAFQFIETLKETDLPLPYQILIITKESGVICWRYPQPRALSKIKVFPVPFHTTANIKINCHLQYYSEVDGEYVPYSEFTLSESDTNILELPSRKVTASIWRVVMIQSMITVDKSFFEDDFEDDDEKEDFKLQHKNIIDILQPASTTEEYLSNDPTNFKLHPKALVACMRIDSYFSSKLVPNLQAVLNLTNIQLNLINHLRLENAKSPEILTNYKFAKNDLTQTQTFFSAFLTDFKIHGNIYNDMQISIQNEFNFRCEILDYSYLNVQPMIEDFNFKSFFDFGDNFINSNIITSEIKMRYGPCIGHTIAVSEKNWEQILTDGSRSSTDLIILTRFVICNDTTIPLLFGQFQTEEAIFLQPKHFCMYSFRSDRLEQKLTFSFNWVKSNPLLIDKEGVQLIQIQENVLIIKIEKISSSQKKITIKGQVEFLNMTDESFVINYKPESENKINSEPIDFEMNRKSNISIFGGCDSKMNSGIRLKLNSLEKKGWSGEIPLQKSGRNNAPWLVKVPCNSNKLFTSFWVRVIREEITVDVTNKKKLERVLVTIWPLFILKSMLSVDTLGYEAKSLKEFEVIGRGEEKQMELPGTHEDDHDLVFKMNFNSPYSEDKQRALLSYKLVDKNKFFSFPDKFNSIDATFEELVKKNEIKWPCSREEEQRWLRNSTKDDVTLPIYKCSLSRELSCSLMLNISPWCLFLNSTGIDVKITSENLNKEMEPNNVLMPFFIKDGFTISVKDNLMWIKSSIVYLTEKSPGDRSVPYQILPEEGSITLLLQSNEGLIKLILTVLNENGIKIFILSSCYVVTNHSQHDLSVWMFAIGVFEKSDLITPKDFTEIGSYDLFTNNKKGRNSKGNPVATFFNLSRDKMGLGKKDPAFNYFMVVRRNCYYSGPIVINKAVNRKCLSVPNKGRHLPLSLSIVEHQDQFYISIYDDLSPAISIKNSTEISFYVAQSDSLNPAIPATPIKECPDEHFDWYQIIPGKTKIFYTPPGVDESFPDVKKTEFGLIFAVETSQNIRWSLPVKLMETKDIFLSIPVQGDLKISVDCGMRTIKVRIDYISQNQEFCARDIRTRLLNPGNEILDSPICLFPVISVKDDFLEENPNSLKLNLKLFIKEINLTLFSDVEEKIYLKSDLISLSVNDVGISFEGNCNKLEFTCSDFQIDNQMFSSNKFDFPVILCSQNPLRDRILTINPFSLENTLAKCNENPLIKISVQFYEKEFSAEKIILKVNPIRAYIEDTYINQLLDYLVECVPNNLIYSNEIKELREKIPERTVIIPRFVETQSLLLSEPFKLKLIRIEPLNVLLSVHTCMRLYIALDHSPLGFSMFEKTDINTLPLKFGYILGMHYLSGALFGAGWVVGSLEILGSPSGLARSVSTGIRDFVSMPVQGLLRGPWGFIVGITQGSASLIKNITAGTVNSVTKLAASVARNLDRLTLDEEHLQITDTIRRSRPQGFSEGFSQGLTGLGISILGAVGGLARHPLEARSPGQVISGVGKGIVGAFTKPISGAAELVALTGQGMLHSVGYNTLPQPRSQPFIKNTSLGPASCKIGWKYSLFLAEHVLFSSLATLSSKTGMKSVFIGLTPNLITILDINKDNLIEAISIEKVQPMIDEFDSSLIVLKVDSKMQQPTEQTSEIEINRYSVTRTFRFVQESNDQLPIFSQLQNLTNSNDEIGCFIDEPNVEEHKIVLYMNKNLAQHFISYIHLIKRSISPSSRTDFSPYESERF